MNKTISQARSHNYLHQVKGSAVFKGLAVACTFFAIPLMIHYLGQEQFGVWSTLLSVLTWVSFFDLGLGNGLRNKLAEALANDQPEEARSYISSAYSLIGIISFILFVCIVIAAFSVSWQAVFNTELLSEETLRYAILITGLSITVNFWLGLINSVLNAVQKTAVVVLGQFLFNALTLFLVYVLTMTTNASLLYLAIAYGGSMVGTNILLSRWFYKKNMIFLPKLSVDFSHVRPLLSLGLQFFVLQIAVLVIFATDKILITQLFGPEFVTPYDVIFKLFSVISIIYGLITAPLWSSYTDAYHRSDFVWIKGVLRKQFLIFGGIVLAVGCLILIAKQVIAVWIGGDIVVSLPLVVSMGFFILISTWNNIFALLLNGIGKIRLQIYSAVFAMFMNIPLSIYFTQYLGFGVSGVVLATCASLSLFAMIGPIQVRSILISKIL